MPSFFQKEMKWIVREDNRGCHFLLKVKVVGPQGMHKQGSEAESGVFLDLIGLKWNVRIGNGEGVQAATHVAT